MDVGSDHVWKNVLLCIGLRDARCTRFIGVSSPRSILGISQIACSQLTANFAANGVLDSSTSTEFLISVYFILARYRTILIEHSTLLYVPQCSTAKNTTFSPQTAVFPWFVWISEKTAVIFLFLLSVR